LGCVSQSMHGVWLLIKREFMVLGNLGVVFGNFHILWTVFDQVQGQGWSFDQVPS